MKDALQGRSSVRLPAMLNVRVKLAFEMPLSGKLKEVDDASADGAGFSIPM